MKLPPSHAPKTEFVNAPGSTLPEEFAIRARANPEDIKLMAENKKELMDLQKEALCRQYVIMVDRSGSMSEQDGKNGTRWDSARKAVEKVVHTVFEYDVDHTVPLYLFDHECLFLGELTSPSQVLGVFNDFGPRGTTDLNTTLKQAIETYAGSKRPNYDVVPGTTFLVFLDGAVNDEEEVVRTIKYYANPKNGYIANHTQIAISFIQIGDDNGATRFLKRLDDDMGEIDICDTKKDDFLSEKDGVDRLLHDAIFD